MSNCSWRQATKHYVDTTIVTVMCHDMGQERFYSTKSGTLIKFNLSRGHKREKSINFAA